MKLWALVGCVTFLIVGIFISGCCWKGVEGHSIPIERTSGSITYDNNDYYIIHPNNLILDNGDMLSVTYGGTIENYHLFNAWSKVAFDDRVSLFAIPHKDCEVEEAFSPEEIGSDSHIREITIRNGKCFVIAKEMRLQID